MPLETAASILLTASIRAFFAAPASPDATATRTRFTQVRTLVRMLRLRAVRLIVWRTRFFAEACWATTDVLPLGTRVVALPERAVKPVIKHLKPAL